MSDQERATEILEAFEGPIEPASVSAIYQLGLGVVAVAMVALPLIYLGIIGLAGYGVYYHAAHNQHILHTDGSGGPLFGYIAPLIIGTVLVLFMIKPLFARPVQEDKPRRLRREEQPLLFAFVERICETVRAPRPREIRVDLQVNASASFRRGFLSMLGRDMTLTIGLPLVEGFTLRQLAGVLAHEFGHFAQGGGMRVTYVIRRVNRWFSRVVYERDSWDEALVAGSQIDIRIGIIFWVARLFVWLTRQLLKGLMYAGHAISCFMLRQMEFDADRYEARLAGSQTFEQTATRLLQLNVASQGAFADLGAAWDEGRLADSLPGLILANVDQIPEELWRSIHQQVMETDTGLLETHPSDKDRVASAHRESAPGVFRIEGPAREVFGRYDALCRSVSSSFYREVLGERFSPERLVPVAEIVRRQREATEEHEATVRYFHGLLHPWRPLPINPAWITPPADPGATRQAVIDARARMDERAAPYEQAVGRFSELDDQRLEIRQARELIGAGFKLDAGQFGLSKATTVAASQRRRKLQEQQRDLDEQLRAFEQAASERLCAALSLYHVPEVADQIERAAERIEQLPALIGTVARIGMTVAEVEELRDLGAVLGALMENLEGNEQHEPLVNAILDKMRRLHDLIERMRRDLHHHTYPLDHADGEISLALFLFEDQLLDKENPGQLYEAAGTAIDRMMSLYGRCLGRLTLFAEDVEQVIGLPRQPDPAPPD